MFAEAYVVQRLTPRSPARRVVLFDKELNAGYRRHTAGGNPGVG